MPGTTWRTAVFVMASTLGFAQQPDPESDTLAELKQMMDVQVRTATLRKQTLKDAPASVTVITARDIERFGYRTLSEALANIRGFYTSSDSVLSFVGVRGFSLLGDYNTRFLVMINGHSLTDNVYGAMYYFGQDFPIDMQLVDQIEIVRGPSSALYGSNGVFATVNIITKKPATAAPAQVTAEAGSFGAERVGAFSSFAMGRGVKALVSASGLNRFGRTADLTDAGLSGGPLAVRGLDREFGYHTFATVEWRNWSVTALFSEHRAITPIGWYGSDIGDTGTRDLESRDLVEAAWTRPVGQTSEMKFRVHYDRYRYDGLFVYVDGPCFDGALGDWIGTQFTYQSSVKRLGIITLGAETSFDLRNRQYDFTIPRTNEGPQRNEVFDVSHRQAAAGLFLQDEIQIRPGWVAYLGGRIDKTSDDAAFFSPRAALVYTRGSTAYKLMFGRAFRNPSTFEEYWYPSPTLRAERIDTFEVAWEQTILRRINLIASAFHYRAAGLIQGVPVSESELQYRNASTARASGLEGEINGRLTDWLEAGASFSVERTRSVDSGRRLQNSPAHLGNWHVLVPLARGRLTTAGSVRYVSSRDTAYGDRVPAVAVADLTVTIRRPLASMDLQFGIRNLLNAAYSDPLSTEHTPHLLPAPGRNWFLRLTWTHE